MTDPLPTPNSRRPAGVPRRPAEVPPLPPDAPPLPATIVVPVVHAASTGALGPAEGDHVAVEAPLEVRFSGKAATVLMRTPGDDDDLVRGFLLAEGVITGPDDLVRIERPADLREGEVGNVVDLELFPSPNAREIDRPLYSSSSCGACGKRSIDSLDLPIAPVPPGFRMRRSVLASLPTRMRAAQPIFEQTGGLHACALFDADGTLLCLREDVGRHNAVDKVVGWALARRRLPLASCVLLVSGRISFELAQKAAIAGAPVLAAVGAPSSLAIELGQRYGLTLVGFVRSSAMNVYTHPDRVAD